MKQIIQIALIFTALSSLAHAFPVDSITVTQSQLTQLNDTKAKIPLANKLLTSALQPFFKKNLIEILKTDISLAGTYPNTVVQDKHCHLDDPKVEAKDNRLSGTMLANSYLNASIAIKWDEVEAIMNAYLKAQLEVDTHLQIKERQKVFGHCEKIASDTLKMKLVSSGQNLLGIMMDAKNIQLKKENGTWNLEFDFNITIVSKIMKWNVDEFKASGGCKVKVLGFTILSFCGYVEDKAKPMIQKYENQVSEISAPKILKKIQDKIQTAVGTHVKIPLKLPLEVRKRSWLEQKFDQLKNWISRKKFDNVLTGRW